MNEVKNEITTRIVILAISGRWKDWDESQNIGTVFHFSNEVLQDIGDKNIDELMELNEYLLITTEKLTKANKELS